MAKERTLKDIIRELYKDVKPITKSDFLIELRQYLNEHSLTYADSSILNAVRNCKLHFIENSNETTDTNATKTQKVTRNGTTYMRSPKRKETTQGRNSDAEVEARLECCRTLYNKDPYNWNHKNFLPAYRKSLIEHNLSTVSDNTLRNDIRKCNLILSSKKSLSHHHRTTLNTLGYEFGYYIRQIRISCKSYDKLLYNFEKAKKDITKDDILLSVEKIIDAAKSVDAPDKTLTTKKTISKHTLVHLYIILNTKGLERYFADTFDISCPQPKNFLYIETHDYCTEIVFEYRNFDFMIDKIYEIISHIPIEE